MAKLLKVKGRYGDEYLFAFTRSELSEIISRVTRSSISAILEELNIEGLIDITEKEVKQEKVE